MKGVGILTLFPIKKIVSLNSSYSIKFFLNTQTNKEQNQQTKEQSSHTIFKKVWLIGTAPVIVYLSLVGPET